MTFELSIDESSDTFDALLQGMKSFNREAAGIAPSQKFNVALRDESGRIAGGVAATLSSDAMYLDIVWADEGARGKGQGRAMMDMVEMEGRRRGARYAWLYTMSWQARPFYEKLGYSCIGEMPYMAEKYRQYFMWKRL